MAAGSLMLIYTHANPLNETTIVGVANKCLDNRYNRLISMNPIQLYTCNQTPAQNWIIGTDGTIKNQGFCLDVKYAGMISTTPVWLYRCNYSPAQKWAVQPNGSIINPHSGLCLDDKFSGSSDGNKIWMYSCNNTVAQKWIVTSHASGTPNPTPSPTPAPGTTTTPPPVTSSAPPVGTSAQVDFRKPTYALNNYSLGITISTYSGGGQANINKSAAWKQNVQNLGPLAYRIPLRYNNGNPGSSAGGAQSSGDAATYIQNIKSMNGVPVVVVGGDTSDNNFTNADAAGLVHYFNDNGGQHGGPVKAWVIGNEYTNPNNDPIGYQVHLAGWAAAMKGADPTITLSAPASPDMKYAGTSIGEAVGNASKYIDYLSYHAYQGRSAGLAGTSDYETYANTYRNKYINAQNFGTRAGYVSPALEEFNWAPYYSNNTEFFDWHNTVFFASVIGHSLSAGAHAYQYADSNGALGLMNDGTSQANQPGTFMTKFPDYWGIAMWTGLNGTFRRFGNNMVQSSSSVANVEVYATDNNKIVVVNKDTVDHPITIGVGGVNASGQYDAWQTNKNLPLAAPTRILLKAAYAKNTISMNLPAGTVTELEL